MYLNINAIDKIMKCYLIYTTPIITWQAKSHVTHANSVSKEKVSKRLQVSTVTFQCISCLPTWPRSPVRTDLFCPATGWRVALSNYMESKIRSRVRWLRFLQSLSSHFFTSSPQLHQFLSLSEVLEFRFGCLLAFFTTILIYTFLDCPKHHCWHSLCFLYPQEFDYWFVHHFSWDFRKERSKVHVSSYL